MRKQQKIWEEEHRLQQTLPSLHATKASSFVQAFADFLKDKHIPLSGKIVDIGCGKGRNAFYFANNGMDVYALDYSTVAITQAETQADRLHLADKIHFITTPIDTQWPFPDNYFDFAIDCFSSIDIETATGRNTYRDELFRTLKPQGYAMVSVVSAHDEMEGELMRQHPGKEKNSVYWPFNGKFQKNYDENELRAFYKKFTILVMKELTKSTYKLDTHYNATNFLLILQKPNL